MMTALCKADRRVNSRRSLVTLLQSLSRRADWYRMNQMLTPMHEIRLQRVAGEISGCVARLDSNTLISHRYVVKDVMSYVFEGLSEPKSANLTSIESEVADIMRDRSRSAMAAQHAFLLHSELLTRRNDFVLFDTLTVSPDNYSVVFSKGSRAFSEYIRKVANYVEGHSYFAAVEYGTQTHRLHIHVLHMFSAFRGSPPGDPNKGRKIPDRREVSKFKTFWSYGWSVPIAVRMSLNDAWARLGWRWPDDRRTGKGLVVKGPGAVAGYVSKYVSKSYKSHQRSRYLWRVRKSQKLGLTLIQEFLIGMSIPALVLIASKATVVKFDRIIVPATILQVAAFRILRDQFSVNLFEFGKICQPLPSLLQSLRGLTLSTEAFSLLNILCTEIGILPSVALFEDAFEEIAQRSFEYGKLFSGSSGVSISVRDS